MFHRIIRYSSHCSFFKKERIDIMHYYYDVLANLEIDLWDFYEWEETDAILPIKKVPLVRVTESDIKSFTDSLK